MVDDLNQQKNKIISVLSHDVAAPMNSLSTLLYLQSKENISEPELKTYLPKLSEQFNNVSVLLFSLVRWSKSQMEGFVLNKTKINLVDIIDKNAKLFHIQLIDKGLELKLTADRSAYHVKADEDMIRIALRNIISNAIKFARNGTSIQLEVLKNDQNKVLVCITNRGDQIPSALIDKLFTFQMPSSLDTRGERGTGLGLALTAFFVRLNGGDIYLVSSSEETTTFCIEMPELVEQSVPS